MPSEREDAPKALFSYLNQPVGWRENDGRLNGHSNRWESREIAHCLNNLGFAVDTIGHNDFRFKPDGEYNVLLDVHKNLQRLAPLCPSAIKLLHITGSYPRYQNKAELRRASEFEERTGVKYQPKRLANEEELFDQSLAVADHCSLIGNEQTLRTFPEGLRSKVTTVTVSASNGYVKPLERLMNNKKEFVWFFGGGAVHKGLDLVLEAFKRLPELHLNVIGNVSWEKDFIDAYGDDLLRSDNIRYHSSLNPNGQRFKQVMDRCFAFVAPSCSEGISPAVATVLQAGLYPIISRETGVTLPEGHGTYLESCTIDEIVQACQDVEDRSEESLQKDIQACQAFALERYSRKAFTSDMSSYLADAIR